MPADRPPVVVRRIAAFLRGVPGVPAGSHILVATSGGPDSTVLAAVLAELAPAHGLRLTLAHLRHGLRSPADEAADEAAVRALGATLGADVHTAALQVAAGSNLEARARRERRRGLERIAAEVGATHIALGHTQDDQAETVLMRLLRGGGRGGLAAMRACNGTVVRPLLTARRTDVRWYLAARRLPAMLDRTNADLYFTRNRIRRLLLPLLATEFNPRITVALAGLATRWRDEEDVLAAHAATLSARLCTGDRLDCDVATLPPALARRVVRSWLASLGLRTATAAHIERVVRAAGPGARGGVVLPGPRRVVREGGHLVCRAGYAEVPQAYSEPLAVGGNIVRETWRLEVSDPRPWNRGESARCADDAALLDADALPGPLLVRSPRRGDRVHVPHVGTRKLQDVFIDRKVPRESRAGLPVLASGAAVVWVPAVVRSSVARVGEQTLRVLTVRFFRER